ATRVETLMQVVGDLPVAPSRLRPEVPADLEAICLRCLEKKPGQRFATAAELADMLHRFLDGLPAQVRPRDDRPPEPPNPRRRLASVLLWSWLAGTLFFIAMFLLKGAPSDVGKLALCLILSPVLGLACMVLAIFGYGIYRTVVESRTRREVYLLAFSPDGNTLASADAGGSLKLWDVPAERLRMSISLQAPPARAAPSTGLVERLRTLLRAFKTFPESILD